MVQYFHGSDGTRLAFQVQGSGRPLLCLSGLTRTMADFDHVLPHLAGLQVIRMDYRGRGASDWADPATYTIVQEAEDALALLDHLGIASTAILGTSRGGLVALVLGHLARARLTGVFFNDIGPVIERPGLERIARYVGVTPVERTLQDHAEGLARSPGFANVPAERWLAEAQARVRVTADGLRLNYDPALRQGFVAALNAPVTDLWPLFDALTDLPLAAIRGENSDLIAAATLTAMQRRRPDLIAATVPDRGHVPFLDEAESLAALSRFAKALP